MRQTLAGWVLGAMLAGAAAAQDVQPREPGIEDAISGQLEAFTRDDLDGAFDFAAPGIQGIFRTPERFGSMVQNGYPMVWRPGEVRFADLIDRNGRLYQQVEITGPRGGRHLLEYEMLEIDGAWRIGGVRILEAPDPIA